MATDARVFPYRGPKDWQLETVFQYRKYRIESLVNRGVSRYLAIADFRDETGAPYDLRGARFEVKELSEHWLCQILDNNGSIVRVLCYCLDESHCTENPHFIVSAMTYLEPDVPRAQTYMKPLVLNFEWGR